MDKLKIVITGDNYQEKRKIISDLHEKLLGHYCPLVFSVNEYLDFWNQQPTFSGLDGDKMLEENIKRENYLELELCSLCLKPERIVLSLNGLLDFKDHIYKHLYDKALKNSNLTDIDLMDRYDIVFYNKSSNTKDKQKYSLSNWMGHEKLIVLEDELSLKQKEDIIISNIKKHMNYNIDKDNLGIDISDYDISYYKENAVKATKEIKRYREFRNDDVSDVRIKRTIDGNSSYHYSEVEDGMLRYTLICTKESYEDDRAARHRFLYSKELEELFFYENNTMYKIVIDGDKTYLNILSGENKMPQHLKLKEEVKKAPAKKLLVIKRNFKK